MPEPTARELSLMYFDRLRPDILGLLEVAEDPDGFDEEKRLQLIERNGSLGKWLVSSARKSLD
jgi:hypothetical protein